jgi:hypothetical protein
MTTTPEATKGVPRIEANPAPTYRADHNALADFVRDNVDSSVATFSALPSTGNWAGRHRYVVAERSWYVWVSTASGWVPDTDETVTSFTFQGIYTSAAGAFQPVQVVTQDGRVYLEGVASNNTAATFDAGALYTLGTVPAALAPRAQQRFACPWGDTGLAVVDIDANGAVRFKLNVASPNTPVGAFNMGLSPCNWRLKRR